MLLESVLLVQQTGRIVKCTGHGKNEHWILLPPLLLLLQSLQCSWLMKLVACSAYMYSVEMSLITCPGNNHCSGLPRK